MDEIKKTGLALVVVILWSIALFIYWAISGKDLIMIFFAVAVFVTGLFLIIVLKYPLSKFTKIAIEVGDFLTRKRPASKK